MTLGEKWNISGHISNLRMSLLLLSHFIRVRLCATPIDGSPQASPSLGFSRQVHWSGLPFPSPMHESEKWKWSHSVVSNSSDPMDCSPPGSSVHGIFQTKVLEWGAHQGLWASEPWGNSGCENTGHWPQIGEVHIKEMVSVSPNSFTCPYIKSTKFLSLAYLVSLINSNLLMFPTTCPLLQNSYVS